MRRICGLSSQTRNRNLLKSMRNMVHALGVHLKTTVYPALTISRRRLTNGCGWLWGSAEIGAGFSIRCGFLTKASLLPASGAGLRFVNERIARAAATSGVFHQ